MSAFDPVSWLVSLAAFIYEWLLSRSWAKILLGAIPFAILVGLAMFVWIGGRLDSDALADRYLEIAAEEVQDWEKNLFSKLTSTAKPANEEVTEDLASIDQLEIELQPNQESATTLSAFGEMLYRRVELLRPNAQSQFVIGTNLVMRGGVTQGQNILKRIAPDDSQGDPRAHNILAISYLNQYVNSPDPQIIPLLQHHADAASEWSKTPKEVLLASVDLNWQRQNVDRSLEVLERAASRFPELHLMLFQRAAMASQDDLAETARQKAIVHFEGLLEADAKNDVVRVQLAQLLGTDDDSLDKIERLLKTGIDLEPTGNLSRALSEVYRIRFVKAFLASEGRLEDYSLLEQALEIDPENPQVVEQVARLIRDGFQPTPVLKSALDSMLSSGEANVGTHAVLSEYYLAEDQRSKAIEHLEKVFKAAPAEVKFANNLAYLYADQGRLEEAQQVARTCLEILRRNNLQRQPFVDELLDTLGMIYQKMDQPSDAISTFELALRFNPNRIDSRQRLASIYREMGNEGIAEAHEEAIKAIKAAQQQAAQQQAAQQRESSGELQQPDESSPADGDEGSPEEDT